MGKKVDTKFQLLIGRIATMYTKEDKNTTQISKELKVPESTVRSLIQRYHIEKMPKAV